MLKDIKKLLEHNALTLALIASIILAILSLSTVPKINLGLNLRSADKYLHFIAYFGLSLLWYFALKDKIQQTLFKIFVPLGLILYGFLLEGLQSGLTQYRTGDIYDAIANTTGVIVALVLFGRIMKWYRRI